MSKLLASLILTAFAFSAQAASHAGGAPMKADKPAAAASAAKTDKAAAKPAAAASAAAKPAMKKEEAKK